MYQKSGVTTQQVNILSMINALTVMPAVRKLLTTSRETTNTVIHTSINNRPHLKKKLDVKPHWKPALLKRLGMAPKAIRFT